MPPPLRVQHSREQPIPDAVLSPVAECWISKLVHTDCPRAELLSFIQLIAGLHTTNFARTLGAMMHHHHGIWATTDAAGREPIYLAVECMLETASQLLTSYFLPLTSHFLPLKGACSSTAVTSYFLLLTSYFLLPTS